ANGNNICMKTISQQLISAHCMWERLLYFFSSRRRHTRSVSAFLLNRSSDLNMLGTFVKDWFRYESHFVHGRDSLVDILKERGLLSESDAVQPLIGKKS